MTILVKEVSLQKSLEHKRQLSKSVPLLNITSFFHNWVPLKFKHLYLRTWFLQVKFVAGGWHKLLIPL